MIILKKIIFGITSLTIGGAERVLVDLANKLSEEYNVTIFTIYDGGELKKELNSNIKKIALYRKSYKELSKMEKIKASLKLLVYKKKIYEAIMKRGFDTQVAFLEGPVTRLFAEPASQIAIKKLSSGSSASSEIGAPGLTIVAKLRIRLMISPTRCGCRKGCKCA